MYIGAATSGKVGGRVIFFSLFFFAVPRFAHLPGARELLPV